MMDMRIQNNPAFFQAERLYQQQKPNPSESPEDVNFLQLLNEKEDDTQVSAPSEQVLSIPERATLHVLFGSEKPDDSSFYGKNQSAQIYKGHLLDVAG